MSPKQPFQSLDVADSGLSEHRYTVGSLPDERHSKIKPSTPQRSIRNLMKARISWLKGADNYPQRASQQLAELFTASQESISSLPASSEQSPPTSSLSDIDLFETPELTFPIITYPKDSLVPVVIMCQYPTTSTSQHGTKRRNEARRGSILSLLGSRDSGVNVSGRSGSVATRV